MAEPADGWLPAGRVGRPHGLDGSFIVTRPDVRLLAAATELMVGDEVRGVERRAGTDAKPILRLAGCTRREDAEALRGATLMTRRGDAPPLGEDEYWAEDLVGCAVVDGDRPVGEVASLIALPSCEALEVRRPEGGTVLVPLVRDAVRSVDVEARVVDVHMAFLEGEGG